MSTIVTIGMALCGLLVFCAGLSFWRGHKDDPESVKIYRTISIIGAIVALIFGAQIFLA